MNYKKSVNAFIFLKSFLRSMEVHFISGIGFSGNVFLIDADKPTLIDTGWDSDISYMAQKIDEILRGRKLAYIILTHRHIDHVGGANAFKEKYGAPVLAHEEAAQSLRDGDVISTGARMFGGNLSPIELETVKDGDEIDLGSDKLKVLHTPGHSICSMCLMANDGQLFSGDTVFADGGVGRWDLPTGDLKQLKESLHRLLALPVTDFYPGHGPFVEKHGLQHIKMGLDYLMEFAIYG